MWEAAKEPNLFCHPIATQCSHIRGQFVTRSDWRSVAPPTGSRHPQGCVDRRRRLAVICVEHVRVDRKRHAWFGAAQIVTISTPGDEGCGFLDGFKDMSPAVDILGPLIIKRQFRSKSSCCLRSSSSGRVVARLRHARPVMARPCSPCARIRSGLTTDYR